MSTRATRNDRLLSLAVLCCYTVTLAMGTSYDYGFDPTKALNAKRQSPGFIVTTGMPLNQDGTVPVRPEIRTLQQDADRWELYILALDMMQHTDQTDPSSWFGITSIHGVPFEPWGGVLPTAGNEMSGYCHHEDILFPTWHRAYVALYEQELCARVQYIASLYEDDLLTRFETAAANCRAPYFDWAATPSRGGSILPASVGGSPKINVSGPAGTQYINNPLFTYSFKPPDPNMFFNITPWADWSSTRRAPSSSSPNAPSNNSAVEKNLRNHIVQNQQRLYNLFSSYSNYTLVSNEGWAADTSQYDSFESLHDNVHAMLGGSDGHMTIVPFSAFDPLFFLHHCMVDRLFALWQVLYPEAWIAPEAARTNSYTTSVGEILDGSSALTPFYASSNGTFWNSDMLRDPTVLGYTYPEMAGISLSDTSSIAAGRSRVVASINQLYGRYSVNSVSLNSKRSEPAQGHRPSRRSGLSSADKSSQSGPQESLPVDGIISDKGQYREWMCNIRVQKQGLEGPFTVHLALADDPSYHIGSMGVFASPPAFASLMQMAPDAQYVSSVVPLTKILVDKVADGTLVSLNPEEVAGYLTKNLVVGAIKSDTTEVCPEDVPGLSIKIVSALVQAAENEEHLPEWNDADYELDFM